ncbi:MAG TPA: 50S ribosomal protein L15 [Candidatus Deferrimicrobium sp.]|nr:50S ribosomal protein L15 [Candidatus Deferrimicrobium sp.]
MGEPGLKLHTLHPAPGASKERRRVGRGSGSGLGKTSGRGHKGAGQHSSHRGKRGHEGGQMPLHRRVPKRGFTNIFRTKWQIVNLSVLARCDPGEVTAETLRALGAIKHLKYPLKVLGNGDVEKAYVVKAAAFSKSAIAKIEAAGGKAEVAA